MRLYHSVPPDGFERKRISGSRNAGPLRKISACLRCIRGITHHPVPQRHFHDSIRNGGLRSIVGLPGR